MKVQKKNELDMTRGSLLKQMIIFSVPLIITNVFQLLYSAVDMIVVGRFAGAQALSAVGSTGVLVNLVVMCFMGLSMGSGVVISRAFGARDRQTIQNTVHSSILLAIVGGIILSILGLFLTRPLLVLVGTPADVIDGATLYMQIFFIGTPFNLVYNFGASMLRAVGDTKRPLRILIVAGIVNLVLNLIFVIYYNMSVAGVAIATIISQAISALLVMRCLMTASNDLHLDLKKLKMHKAEMKDIVKIGLPAGIQSSLFTISNVTVQSAVNSFGSIVIAGNAAGSNLEGFIFSSMSCVTQAIITSTGQNIGAQQYKRVRKGLYHGIGLTLFLAAFWATLLYTLAPILVALYNNDPEVIKIGVIRLQFMCIPYTLSGIMDNLTGYLRGRGYSFSPAVITLVFACLLRVVWIAAVFPFHRTIMTIYWIYPISWVLTATTLTLLIYKVRKTLPMGDLQRV